MLHVFVIMLIVNMFIVDMLNVLVLSGITPYVLALNLSVIMPCVNMLAVIMMIVTDAECLYVECLMLIVIKMSVDMLKVIVLSVIIPYVLVLAERHHVMCQYADCHYEKRH
jgi:hypothetical protein